MTTWAVLGRFSSGLIFFTLALTVLFLRYRSRRISLARHLLWLGGFGICEALLAWYDLLTRLMPTRPLLSVVVPPMIQGLAYTFLLAFGIQFFVTKEVVQERLLSLLVGINAVWLLPYLAVMWLMRSDWTAMVQPAETMIRYLFAFPGGVLSAIGLRRQSYQSLGISLRRQIRPYLRLVELGLATFGVLSLVLVPPISRVVVTLFNLTTFDAAQSGWIWAVVGTAITYGLARALTTIQSEIEQWVEGVERLQALTEDRERIGRELHDGIIQSIYAAGLLLESILPAIETNPKRAQAQIGRVMDGLNNTIQDIRRYIFDLRSDLPDENLQSGIERLLRDFHINTLLETEFEVTGTVRPITSMQRRRHIFQIVREALANTAKHAQARWVQVQLSYDEESLELTISDDGIGMEKLLVSKGYGLRNIRERARLLDGTLRIESAPGAGVTYHLTVPYT